MRPTTSRSGTPTSPRQVCSPLLAFALLLFILILSIVAYTPVLELLPGYRVEAARSREKSDAKASSVWIPWSG